MKKCNRIIDAGIWLLWKYFIYINKYILILHWYIQNKLQGFAKNIILPVFLSYQLFFIISCCVELNYQCPILLKADQISWSDVNSKKLF